MRHSCSLGTWPCWQAGGYLHCRPVSLRPGPTHCLRAFLLVFCLASHATLCEGRFEADVAAMQRDSSTYCDEPEEVDEFEAWLAGFDLAVRKPDVDHLIAENTFMSELQVSAYAAPSGTCSCTGTATAAPAAAARAAGWGAQMMGLDAAPH